VSNQSLWGPRHLLVFNTSGRCLSPLSCALHGRRGCYLSIVVRGCSKFVCLVITVAATGGVVLPSCGNLSGCTLMGAGGRRRVKCVGYFFTRALTFKKKKKKKIALVGPSRRGGCYIYIHPHTK
jgi:hypothetical protein